MKLTIVAAVFLTFSISAFAVEYPVLTNTSPEQVGFDSKNLTDLMAGFKIKLMPDTPVLIFW
ncbi:esterase [Salmonella enterica subsp. arizonae]|uniref:Esterase n=1 Tax=Salmonella enterica subsp. arizonae TaxID=59203 RepID=A0A447R0H6_SALER|nr:esterase [Salmonella enterica subsp. arizonae]